MRRALLGGLVLLVGCPKPAEAPDAGPAPVVAQLPDAGWLTEAGLDAWLRYQQALSTLPPLPRGDGGAALVRDDVRARAKAEAALRADAGLSVDQVDRIEAVVAEVVTVRTLARLSGGDAVEKFQGALADLGPEQRVKAEAALRELKAKTPAGSLDDVEAKFGADAVRVVLTRESEVTKTWDALLEARGDKR